MALRYDIQLISRLMASLCLTQPSRFCQSDWEESSEEEEKKPAPAVTSAPPKKKGTLKAKLAEKEALRAQEDVNGEDEYDEDAVLDPRTKARLDRERELKSDLDNAAALFGQTSVSGA